jgi:protein-disulfide isomerase
MREIAGLKAGMNLRLAAVFALVAFPVFLWAGDTSPLRPPLGATVALVAFEDLQCPDCADAEALLQEASAKYGIPLVRHDFPLPMHNWAFEAHVIARYFDTMTGWQTGKKPAQRDGHAVIQTADVLPMGEQFRRWVYANQSSINKQNLRGMAERFADQHNMELPAVYDPKGELKAKVLADFSLGQQVGVIHTPTVYVVSLSQRGAPFIESLDRDKMFAMIEQLQAAEKK